MALINCIECSNQVSDLAKDCPHCGAPVELSKKTSCFECGDPLEKDQTICKNCGVDQGLNPNRKKDEKPVKPGVSVEKPKTKPELKTESGAGPESKAANTTSTHQNSATPPPVTTSTRKSGCLRPLLIGGLIVVVLGVIVFNFLPSDLKRELYNVFGIENSDFVRNDLASYIHLEETRHKQNWLGTWVIDGMVYNLHKSITVREVDIKVKFSDYDEVYTIYPFPSLRPGKIFQTAFEIRIRDGHEGAYFEGCEVVDARE